METGASLPQPRWAARDHPMERQGSPNGGLPLIDGGAVLFYFFFRLPVNVPLAIPARSTVPFTESSFSISPS